MKKNKIGVIVGSLRAGSISAGLVNALKSLGPDSMQLETLPIGDLPYYNPDIESSPPSSWLAFREQIKSCKAVLFVTPEYNRSIPAVLKNAVDVASRPYGQSVWSGKPAAVITVSPGQLGGFGANHHLRQALACLNVPVLPAPEIYISGAGDLLGADGEIKSKPTSDFLRDTLSKFETWIARTATA